MNNADTFLKTFNTLEGWLKEKYSEGRYATYYQLVESVSEKDRAVLQYRSFLKSIGDLRNAILHDSDYPASIIADPRSEIVSKFETIRLKIMEPMKLLSKAAKQFDIFTPLSKLSEVLPLMHDNDYSQVLIENQDGTIGLVTREGIAMWVESNIEDDIVSIKDAVLNDVLPFEQEKSWVCVPKDTDIYEGISKLSNPSHRVQALIITEGGSVKQKPLGLFTIWDMKEILPHV